MPDLVRNSVDRFSRDMAHTILRLGICKKRYKNKSVKNKSTVQTVDVYAKCRFSLNWANRHHEKTCLGRFHTRLDTSHRSELEA